MPMTHRRWLLAFVCSLLVSALPSQWIPRGASPAGNCIGAVYDEARAVTVALFLVLPGYHMQTWEWNGTSWSQNVTAGTPGIADDDGIALVYDPIGQRVLAAVAEGPGSNGGWVYRYTGQTWVGLPPGLPRPPGAVEIAAAFDTTRGVLVTHVLAQTWEWDGAVWAQRAVGSPPNDIRRSRLVYDPLQQRTWLLGGRGFDPVTFSYLHNGTAWGWDGSQWTAGPTSSDVARVQHGATFDGMRGRPMFYGGSTEGGPYYSWSSQVRTLWPAHWNFEPSVLVTDSFAMLGSHLATDLARGRIVLVGTETWEFARSGAPQFARFGAGCAGTGGTPQLDLDGGRMAWLGQDLHLRLSSVGPAGFAALVLGLSNSQFGGLPLPVALPGAPGCEALVSPDVFLLALTAAGRAQFVQPIPVATFSLGFTFYGQGLVPDAVNALGFVASNGVAVTVGTP